MQPKPASSQAVLHRVCTLLSCATLRGCGLVLAQFCGSSAPSELALNVLGAHLLSGKLCFRAATSALKRFKAKNKQDFWNGA
ncbi:hypothetical protein WJX73_005040 [Symbiochloris irregularis]|uniref:Secreted protein n=1 Tax=Symbiochloris irregularis TaxID=706552 RepID=A0AAW1NJQ0_9CHLO